MPERNINKVRQICKANNMYSKTSRNRLINAHCHKKFGVSAALDKPALEQLNGFDRI
jgi:hypothetical protein